MNRLFCVKRHTGGIAARQTLTRHPSMIGTRRGLSIPSVFLNGTTIVTAACVRITSIVPSTSSLMIATATCARGGERKPRSRVHIGTCIFP